jgi:hypothetical protein
MHTALAAVPLGVVAYALWPPVDVPLLIAFAVVFGLAGAVLLAICGLALAAKRGSRYARTVLSTMGDGHGGFPGPHL